MQPRQFDLDKVKGGAVVRTVGGKGMTFVAHVPQALPEQRLVMLDQETNYIETYSDTGCYQISGQDSCMDLTCTDKVPSC